MSAFVARLKTFLLQPSSKYSVLFLMVVGVLLGAVLLIGSFVSMEITGSNAFCLSCHEMQAAYDEYIESSHYKNHSGVTTLCGECHLPHKYPLKIFVKASRLAEVWYHLLGVIDTKEKYELNRLNMAQKVWDELRDNGSQYCIACHAFENMRIDKQTLHAQRAHARAVRTDKSCIECHQGVAHKLPAQKIPVAAQPKKEGNPVRCHGCHENILDALPEDHPHVVQAALNLCIQCHVPGTKSPNGTNTFYTYMHSSHRGRIECTGCHKVDGGVFHLIGSDRHQSSSNKDQNGGFLFKGKKIE